jgi:hypothetical protein
MGYITILRVSELVTQLRTGIQCSQNGASGGRLSPSIRPDDYACDEFTFEDKDALPCYRAGCAMQAGNTEETDVNEHLSRRYVQNFGTVALT